MQAHHVNDILISEEQIRQRVTALVQELTALPPREDLVLIGVLRGSFMFFADLVREINRAGIHPRIDFLTLESYGAGTASSGVVHVAKDIRVDVREADVLLVDDILDSGRTLRFACQHIKNKGAQRVRTMTLLDKPSRRAVEIQADFSGFTIEDLFVVGYGLDYDSRYREMPHIAELTFLEE